MAGRVSAVVVLAVIAFNCLGLSKKTGKKIKANVKFYVWELFFIELKYCLNIVIITCQFTVVVVICSIHLWLWSMNSQKNGKFYFDSFIFIMRTLEWILIYLYCI